VTVDDELDREREAATLQIPPYRVDHGAFISTPDGHTDLDKDEFLARHRARPTAAERSEKQRRNVALFQDVLRFADEIPDDLGSLDDPDDAA
jgi:hypothetical protein